VLLSFSFLSKQRGGFGERRRHRGPAAGLVSEAVRRMRHGGGAARWCDGAEAQVWASWSTGFELGLGASRGGEHGNELGGAGGD
jgi:hypothetical protein